MDNRHAGRRLARHIPGDTDSQSWPASRRRGSRRRFVVALVGLAFAIGLAGSAQQSSPRRIVAIGDVHGAADAFIEILQTAGLVDNQQHWSGGTATFVQTGDYFDRGADIRRVLDLLMRLEDEARRAGGRVEVLLGNHEVMNLIHEFRDVSPAAFASFADQRSEDRRGKAYEERVAVAKRAAAASPSRDEWMKAHPSGFIEYVDALGPEGPTGRWLRSRKVVLALDGSIFMHAGLSPNTPGELDEVNRQVARSLAAWDETMELMTRAGVVRPFFTLNEVLAATAEELQRIAAALKEGRSPGEHVTREYVQHLEELARIGTSPLLAADGPLWFRGLASSSPEAESQVDALLTRFRMDRFVIGHTPTLPGRITPRFAGRVIPIDTGMLSSYFKGGRASALELQGNRITAIYTTEREVLSDR
jgi:hypothetical protein